MLLLDLTLDTPAENLALDEALLVEAELGTGPSGILRLWESPQLCAVLGRSSQAAVEVNLEECERRNIPVLRRSSGGATVLIGPGCLMYTVLLDYETLPHLRAIDEAHEHVLSRIATAIKSAVAGNVHLAGTSDLALGDRKFSGNSLRCRKEHFLYHGTLLYDFPLDLIEACLFRAPREPEYRHDRGHRAFVTNLPTDATLLRQEIAVAWDATEPYDAWPRERTAQLVAEKYSQASWNLQR